MSPSDVSDGANGGSPANGKPPAGTTEFKARYGDGTNAKRYDALVHFGPNTLNIRYRDFPPQAWSYERLQTANTLGPRETEVIISSSEHPGATLFVPSAAFVSELRTRARHLTTARTTLRMARPGLILGGLAAAITGAIFFFDLAPSKAVAQLLPAKATQQLGERVLEDIAKDRARCVEPKGRAALEALVRRLQPDRPANAAPVLVLDWTLVNALALPGGTVILTRGIINQSSSPEELAGVLGHEIGHGIELHPEAGLVRALGLYTLLQFVTTGQPGTLGNVGLAVVALRYTRTAEIEADTHAVNMLRRAGIAQKPLAGFFRRIAGPRPSGGSGSGTGSGTGDNQQKRGGGLGLPDVLSTHPDPLERAKRIENLPDYPVTPAMTAQEWADLKAVCSVTQP
jgi:beta-barrel assembly-enhancing protease